MEVSPEFLIKLLADVGLPTVMLVGVLYVANTFAKTYLERMVERMETINHDARDGIASATANREAILRVENKMEAQTQVLTEIKTILQNRIDHRTGDNHA